MSEDAVVSLFCEWFAPAAAEDGARRPLSRNAKHGAKRRRRWCRVARDAKRVLPADEYAAVVEAAKAAVPEDLRGSGTVQESSAFLRARYRLLRERLAGGAA